MMRSATVSGVSALVVAEREGAAGGHAMGRLRDLSRLAGWFGRSRSHPAVVSIARLDRQRTRKERQTAKAIVVAR